MDWFLRMVKISQQEVRSEAAKAHASKSIAEFGGVLDLPWQPFPISSLAQVSRSD